MGLLSWLNRREDSELAAPSAPDSTTSKTVQSAKALDAPSPKQRRDGQIHTPSSLLQEKVQQFDDKDIYVDDIASYFEHVLSRNAELEDALISSRTQITDQQSTITHLLAQLKEARTEAAKAQRNLVTVKTGLEKKAKAQLSEANAVYKSQKTENARIKRESEKKEAAMGQRVKDLVKVIEYQMEVERRVRRMGEGAVLQLEYLKCTTDQRYGGLEGAVVSTGEMPMQPDPFVVVLVDGDAYGWAKDIFAPAYGRTPGAVAAFRLRHEVVKYILANESSESNTHLLTASSHSITASSPRAQYMIPPTSKIITRIYINEHPKLHDLRHLDYFRRLSPEARAAFRVEFSGASGLEDFVNVGGGKERADEKIRENFRVFLSNPACHAVFVAACRDNGFARMLEPYRYHQGARHKIKLIGSGYVGKEIAELGFETVDWDSVFERKQPPIEIRNKMAQIVEKGQTILGNDKVLRSGATHDRGGRPEFKRIDFEDSVDANNMPASALFSRLALPMNDLEAMITRHSRGLGMPASLKHMTRITSRSTRLTAVAAEENEDDDID